MRFVSEITSTKYYNENQLVIVTIKDWNLFDDVAEDTYGDLQNNPLENVVVTSPGSVTEPPFTKHNHDNSNCQAKFAATYNPGAQTAVFTSTSYNIVVNPDQVQYEWYYRDISSSSTFTLFHSGIGAAGRVTPSLQLFSNVEYEIELRLSDGNGCSGASNREYSFPGCPDAAYTAMGDAVDPQTIHFSAVPQIAMPGTTVQYNWLIFEDQAHQILAGTMTGQNPSYTFPNQSNTYTSYYVELATGLIGGSCDTRYEKVVQVECGFKKRSRPKVFEFYSSNDRRLGGRIILGRKFMCAESVNYKKKNNGKWKRNKADLLTVGFEPGTYREKDTNTNAGCVNISTSRNVTTYSNRKCVDKVISSSEVTYLRPFTDLISYHRATDNSSTSQPLNYVFH